MATRTRKAAKEIEESANKQEEGKQPVEFLHSGSTMLNLALSGQPRGGWARGRVINIVGDNSSGKTLLCLEACADAFYNLKRKRSKIFPRLSNIEIVYDNREGVMDFPLDEMYGENFASGVEWLQSPSVEAFGKELLTRIDKLKKGTALIYVVDSVDALVSEAQAEKIKAQINETKEKGSYGTEKAKYFSSAFFNHLCGMMKGKDATIFFVSQIRQQIGITFGEQYYRTGGKAFDFYSHQIPWVAEAGKITKTAKGEKRAIGVDVRVRVKKNKVAKPFREAVFKILFDYGVDDVGSLVDKMFPPKATKIEFNGEEYTKDAFTNLLDENEEIKNQVIDKVACDWKEIEQTIKPNRKKKFSVVRDECQKISDRDFDKET